jgi:radical SAM protein with 4Fe4S-binding SPASM domain
VLSTNGTLIDKKTAETIRSAGIIYVGISLDGTKYINDSFRGVEGAFDAAVKAFENCAASGQRVGLRLTLTKKNCADLEAIFNMIESLGIQRACFYHLVPSGRGGRIGGDDLSREESRAALDIIMKRTFDFHTRGKNINILTVDNHADGVYLYLKLLKENPERAEEVRRLLEWNGGGAFSTGVGIGNVDSLGNVHPDQFWQDYTFGNIRQRPFSEIWDDQTDPLMKGLKHKKDYIKGRCRVCQFTSMCTGAMRVRAFRVSGDPWAPDPQCYLTDDEIGYKGEDHL